MSSSVAMERYRVEGLYCASCVARVERAVEAVPGVSEAAVNLATGELRVVGGPPDGSDAVAQAVVGAGYRLVTPEDSASGTRDVDLWRRRFLFALLFTVPVVLAMFRRWVPAAHAWPDGPVHWTLLALTLPVYAVAALPFHRAALRALRHRTADMNTLVSVGTTAAFLYSVAATVAPGALARGGTAPAVYFDTAAVIVTLVLLGRWLEARARERTTDAVRALSTLAPETARKMDASGEEVTVEVSSLAAGDRIRVRPGDRLPADGRILEGECAIDESLVTGEPIPVPKGPGDPVITGTVAVDGALLVHVEHVGGDTFLSRMVRHVQEAQGSKAPSQRLADRVAAVFVPVVLAVAALTFLVWFLVTGEPGRALIPFVSVLLIACPCALGLATPAAILVGMGAGARHGILVKDGQVLEALGRVDAALLDKTGTLTRGRPSLVRVVPREGVAETDLLRWTAAAERVSEHPLAEAVREAARARELDVPASRNFRARPGRGVVARVEDEDVMVGTEDFLAAAEVPGVDTDAGARLGAEGTVLHVARGGRWLGLLLAADPIRPEAEEAVLDLRRLGLEPWLVTGDRPETAAAVAAELGIEEVRARVLPEDKGRVVAELQAAGRRVLFAGDGINDAPALARADVGAALGSGTDLALEAAPVVLLRDDLRLLPGAVRLSRATVRVIRQNLFWAFVYNVLGIPLAAGVFVPLTGWQLHPMVAAGAMAMSSVSVLSNALRLRGFDPLRRS